MFTRPENLKGGKLSGIELAASVPLNLLTPVLDGFGIQASYGYTDSSIKPFAELPSFKIQIPGFSRETATLTAYYEKFGFSARVAARHRSKFIAEVEAFGGDREFPNVREETIADLQLGYEVQSGPVKGLNFLLQINNVNNDAVPRVQLRYRPRHQARHLRAHHPVRRHLQVLTFPGASPQCPRRARGEGVFH